MTQKTVLTELIEDFEEMKKSCNNVGTKIIYDIFIDKAKSKLPKERQDLIDFHVEVMKVGLIGEGERKWSEGYEPLIRATAEQYVHEKFGI